jgi:galactokinase
VSADVERRAQALAAGFAARVGSPPQGVWLAPGRINLIGEHTDYNDGFVLPIAIRAATLAAVSLRDDGRARVWSLQREGVGERRVDELGDEIIADWSGYALGSVWAVRDAAAALGGGADVVVDGGVPEGSGLSSSAALTCACVLALTELAGLPADRTRLALAAQAAENTVAGVPCGIMDQMASLYGREAHAVFLDTRTLEHELVPFDPAAHGLTLLMIDTATPRALADGAYADRRAACARAAGLLGVAALRDATPELLEARGGELDPTDLRRATHVVGENARVEAMVACLRAGRMADAGALMTASHSSLRDDFEVSARSLDTAVDAALAAGALGARMTGGGFGGAAIALAARDRAEPIAQAVAEAFAAAGLAEPETVSVTAAEGARRLA